MDEQQPDQLKLIVSTDIPKRPISDRITVVDTVVHYRKDVGPTAYDTRFSRDLATKEQTYDREIQVTEEWQEINFGWNAGNCGMLILKNVGNRKPYIRSTKEERAEWVEKVIEVATELHDPQWMILMGESMRGVPIDGYKLYVRCRKGETTLVVTVIPA